MTVERFQQLAQLAGAVIAVAGVAAATGKRGLRIVRRLHSFCADALAGPARVREACDLIKAHGRMVELCVTVMSMATFHCDRAGVVVACNHHFTRLEGYEPGCTWMDLFRGDDHGRAVDCWGEFVESGREHMSFDGEWSKDGVSFHVRVRVVRFADDRGSGRWFGVFVST